MLTISVRIFAIAVVWVAMTASVLSAQDLSKYRQYELGSSLADVARQSGISAEPRVIHQRPALIQELIWSPSRVTGFSPEENQAQKMLFQFYDGQLFRMVINYRGDRTEGLTVDDMVEAISAQYGLPLLPATDTSSKSPTSSASQDSSVLRVMPEGWEDSRRSLNLYSSDTIIASWEDAQYSLQLFRSSYLSTFGLALLAKGPNVLARAATLEATRLDELGAPQREIERQQKEIDDNRAKLEAARRLNKTTFRY